MFTAVLKVTLVLATIFITSCQGFAPAGVAPRLPQTLSEPRSDILENAVILDGIVVEMNADTEVTITSLPNRRPGLVLRALDSDIEALVYRTDSFSEIDLISLLQDQIFISGGVRTRQYSTNDQESWALLSGWVSHGESFRPEIHAVSEPVADDSFLHLVMTGEPTDLSAASAKLVSRVALYPATLHGRLLPRVGFAGRLDQIRWTSDIQIDDDLGYTAELPGTGWSLAHVTGDHTYALDRIGYAGIDVGYELTPHEQQILLGAPHDSRPAETFILETTELTRFVAIWRTSGGHASTLLLFPSFGLADSSIGRPLDSSEVIGEFNRSIQDAILLREVP